MKRQLTDNAEYIDQSISRPVKKFTTPNTGEIRCLLSPLIECRRSAAFLSPHWGNYTKTFVEIAFALPDNSKFLTFRGHTWNDNEEMFWDSLNSASNRRIHIARVFERGNLLKEVRKMKSGHHLFILFDLFSKFGETQAIDFFGTRLHVTLGWARLCYMANSVVVMVAPKSLERDEIRLLDVIDPREASSVGEFVQRCKRSAQFSLEQLVTENPAFWFMWEHREKYEAVE